MSLMKQTARPFIWLCMTIIFLLAVAASFSGDNEGEYILGRLAVRKQYRGKAMGQRIMEKAMDYMRTIGVKRITLSSQVQAKGFYETFGFIAEGEEYLDEHCPHIHMVKELAK